MSCIFHAVIIRASSTFDSVVQMSLNTFFGIRNINIASRSSSLLVTDVINVIVTSSVLARNRLTVNYLMFPRVIIGFD